MILQLASYDLLIFVFQDSLLLLISLICIYASLLPIFPFFLIMSKGGERCMPVYMFPLMFKGEKDVFSSFSQNYQSHMSPRSNSLRGRYSSEGEKHLFPENIKAYKTKFCHHQKGGECNFNP